jgi:hypothetical protein
MAPSRTHNQVSDVAASLLNVWSCASSLGLRERGGRTPLQKGESKDKLPTTFVMNVCPSHSRFQPISTDIERSRKLSEEARFRALKAVARVRIPSGLPDKAPTQRLFRVSPADLSNFPVWSKAFMHGSPSATSSRPAQAKLYASWPKAPGEWPNWHSASAWRKRRSPALWTGLSGAVWPSEQPCTATGVNYM